MEALPPDEPGEIDYRALPQWMRGQPGPGPPSEEQAQAERGAAQDDISPWLPEGDWSGRALRTGPD